MNECVRRSGILGGVYGLVLFGDGRASQRKQKVPHNGRAKQQGRSQFLLKEASIPLKRRNSEK